MFSFISICTIATVRSKVRKRDQSDQTCCRSPQPVLAVFADPGPDRSPRRFRCGRAWFPRVDLRKLWALFSVASRRRFGPWAHGALDVLLFRLPGYAEIVFELEAQPEVG